MSDRVLESDLVSDVFVSRWSARSFSDDLVDSESFSACIEAARWAPSSSNNQPWRFVYSTRGSDSWDSFLDCLNEGNREWAHRASHLVILACKDRTERDTPYPMSLFDCGSAWMSFALQARMLGVETHAMGGFDKDAARAAARIPEGFSVTVMIAVGLLGDPDNLPERRRSSERSRSSRKNQSGIASEGVFQELN